MKRQHYSIKEIYYTIQGEGARTGRAAVFCRFSGCNLWSGREEDRDKAICQFCDTDFWGTNGENGGKYTADDLASLIDNLFPKNDHIKYVVCTGGEPLLQLDDELIKAFHLHNMEVAIETNGTIMPPNNVDWICMSPKANSEIIVKKGNELKIVIPQFGLDPMSYINYDFEHFYIQPMDGPDVKKNTLLAINYCLEKPIWKLSIQSHKLIGVK